MTNLHIVADAWTVVAISGVGFVFLHTRGAAGSSYPTTLDTPAPHPPQPAAKVEKSEEKMEKAVDMLARQTVAGLGGTAMKTCLAYIKNALTKPEV